MLINVIFVHRFSQLFNAVLYEYTKDRSCKKIEAMQGSNVIDVY